MTYGVMITMSGPQCVMQPHNTSGHKQLSAILRHHLGWTSELCREMIFIHTLYSLRLFNEGNDTFGIASATTTENRSTFVTLNHDISSVLRNSTGVTGWCC